MLKGYKHTDETKQKIGAASALRRHSEETRQRMRDSANARWEGVPRKVKAPKTPRDYRAVSEETRQKHRDAFERLVQTGIRHRKVIKPPIVRGPRKPASAETRAKMAAAKRGKPSGFTGCHQSEDARRRISQTKRTNGTSNWKGGVPKKRYGVERWRDIVHGRNGGNHCELCARPIRRIHGACCAYSPGAKVAAHIIPYSNGQKPLRKDPANGLLLCGECHDGLDNGPLWYVSLCLGIIHWNEVRFPRLFMDSLPEWYIERMLGPMHTTKQANT